MNFVTLLKYTLGAPISWPYLAWQYGWHKMRTSEKIHSFSSDRGYWRFWFSMLCLCLCAMASVFTANLLGGMLCDSLFPGGGAVPSILAVLMDLWGFYIGSCLGLGGGALIAKLSVKLWCGGEYRIKRWIRAYDEEKKLPPVRYSNHSKYSVSSDYQPNAQGLYEKKGQTYSQKDLWKIFHFLYSQKREKKDELSYLARISPDNATDHDERIIAENSEFNRVLHKVRNLELIEEQPPPELKSPQGDPSRWHRWLKHFSPRKKPPEQKPLEIQETRRWYKLQVGTLFYYVEGSDKEETVEAMRSPKFRIVRSAESKV